MHIAVDGNEANVTKRVGIGEYAYQVLTNLYKSDLKNRYTIFLKNLPNNLPPQRENWDYEIIGPSFLWSQIAFPFHLMTHQEYDVVFTPTHYAPRVSNIPTVVSIMDLSYLYYPHLFKKSDLFKLKNWSSYSVKNASYVLTISNFSKRAIVKNYKISENKIIVTYPGFDSKVYNISHSNADVEKIKKKYHLNRYIMFVGTIQPRKNLSMLVKAYSKIVKRYPDLKLVLIGKKGWLFEPIFNEMQYFLDKRQILYLDYLEDKEVNLLYSGAELSVLPSLYEGFGLTVVEAMASGCLVAVSNVSSLPEIAENAAYYFDPLSENDMANTITKVITQDAIKRKTMISKGLEQAKKYSWEVCGKKKLDALKRFEK